MEAAYASRVRAGFPTGRPQVAFDRSRWAQRTQSKPLQRLRSRTQLPGESDRPDPRVRPITETSYGVSNPSAKITSLTTFVQATPTLVTFAPAIVPLPFVIAQVWPAGSVPTVTA